MSILLSRANQKGAGIMPKPLFVAFYLKEFEIVMTALLK